MNHRIIGTTLPVLELQLESGESVVAISGELSWMSRSINLHTSTQFGGGGLFAAFKRVAGGGSLFMTEYTAQGAPGILAFATRVPGHILPVSQACENLWIEMAGWIQRFPSRSDDVPGM